MGVWSYEPMCNDQILNEIGGYWSESDIEKKIMGIINGDADKFWIGLFANDILGIIADTYGTPKYTNATNTNQAIQEINALKVGDNGGCFYESLWTWASICTIPVQRRNVIFRLAIENAEEHLNYDSNDPTWSDIHELMNIKMEVLAYAKKKYGTQLKDATVINSKKLRALYDMYHGNKNSISSNALVVTCTDKIKRGNRIVSYKIQDAKGNTKVVDRETLVNNVKNGLVKVTNLTLNGDGLY